MNYSLKNKNVIARKDYNGDGSDYFDFALNCKNKGYDLNEFKALGISDDDIDLILKNKENKYKIKKGDLHNYQCGVYDGELYSVRFPLGIWDIILKYDLNSED